MFKYLNITKFDFNRPRLSVSKQEELFNYYASIFSFQFLGLTKKQLLHLFKNEQWYLYNDTDLTTILMNNDYVDLYSFKFFCINYKENQFLLRLNDKYFMSEFENNILFLLNNSYTFFVPPIQEKDLWQEKINELNNYYESFKLLTNL